MWSSTRQMLDPILQTRACQSKEKGEGNRSKFGALAFVLYVSLNLLVKADPGDHWLTGSLWDHSCGSRLWLKMDIAGARQLFKQTPFLVF